MALARASDLAPDPHVARGSALMATPTSSLHELEFFSSLLRAVRDSVIYTDLEGRIGYWNQGASATFGYTSEEMLGRRPEMLYPDEAPSRVEDDHRRILAGEEFAGEWLGRTKAGDPVWLDVKTTVVRGRTGEVMGFIAVGKDITLRKRTERALQASEERYRAFLEQTVEGLWRVELREPVPIDLPEDDQVDRFYAHGYMAECNDAMARMYGLERASDLLGVALGDLLPRSDPHNIEYLREFVRQGYRLLEAESHEQDVEGRDRYFLNNLIGIVEGGMLRHAWGSQRDITERRRAEAQLLQVERLEAVGQLAGGVAHEANNQMSVILGCAEFVIRREDIDEEVRQDVEHIQRAAERTAGITQQLLAFSSRQLLHLQVLEVNASIRKLEPILRRTLSPDQHLVVELGAEPDLVWADAGQLDQVLLNLTLNARDAMSSGGRVSIETSVVNLSADYAGGKEGTEVVPGPYVLIAVSDTGHGMDRATLARVFEPFFTTKGIGRGTGLGLSTVYGIVKQCGGFIWAYSEPGLGTSFKTYLPLAEADAQPEDTPVGALRSKPGETILLVEDEPMVRRVVGRVLREFGYIVEEAGNGREALERLTGQKPSLVITDLIMPEMGGRELAASLTERFPDVPVLFTSGYTDNDAMRRELVHERRPFLQKPLGPDLLLRTVRDLLDGV
ncbi:MAG TPA: PAS domain S-box protein [Gemmatimonadales bacterium]|jgi:PAS domain S-box-containing protein